MRINHSNSALNTYNKYQNANASVQNSYSKLSSGLRINQAADDAAGSAIAEKMKAQIRGLQKAELNIKDGISLLQTAEAALGQIQNPNLIRIRELIIQGSNDTLSTQDKKMVQQEIDEIKRSIDDIVEYTEFNTLKVLRPPVIDKPPGSSLGMTDIVFLIDSTGSMGTAISNVKKNIDSFVNSISTAGINIQIGLVDYKDESPTDGGIKSVVYPFTSNVDDFKIYLDELVANGGGDFPESGLEAIHEALKYPFRESASKNFILITDAMVHDNDDGDGGDGKSIYDIEEIAKRLSVATIKLNVIGPKDSITKDQLERLSIPTNGLYLDISSEFSDELKQLVEVIIEDSGSSNEDDKMFPLNIQVGPNEGHQITIPLYDCRMDKLGLGYLLVDPYSEAMNSLEQIDTVSKLISSRRSEYGSYQNRLEHALQNVQNYEVNLTSALSRVEDVDVAKETIQLKKHQLLLQTSQTMITQVNQMNQGIVELLK
ncbi:flagellin [Sporosarcina sp. E16_8]|uniref:flagellin N-terminal helical domain-containing protein n=1 Tax=Sporosarcina sp. E16_8 TaxID=2789295 RepID=UPI001A915A4E|nr:flagellin [Sporosarcina sp. E16_8]MBO0588415.1 flagellin [Sporosarcina sp. E16_8]